MSNLAALLAQHLNPFGSDDPFDEMGLPPEPPELEIPEHLRPVLPRPMVAEDVVVPAQQAPQPAPAPQAVVSAQDPAIGNRDAMIEKAKRMAALIKQRENTQQSVGAMKEHWRGLGHTGDSLPVDSAGTPYQPEGPPTPTPAQNPANWLRQDQMEPGHLAPNHPTAQGKK